MQSDPLPFPAVRAVGEPRRPTTFLARSPALPAACLPHRRRPDAAEPWPRVVVAVVLDGAAAVAGPPPLALAGPCPRRGPLHQRADGGGGRRSLSQLVALGARGVRHPRRSLGGGASRALTRTSSPG